MTRAAILPLSRRDVLSACAGAAAMAITPARARGAHRAHLPFEQWVASFRAHAVARGVSEATYTRVMSGLKPDMTGLEAIRNQPEFNEQLWQYLNRRVSDWRITTGQEKAKEAAPLLARIEKEFGVDRWIMLGVWGVESAYGDPLVQKNHMRPVIPSLAALAWAEPHRRAYWQQELVNALRIVDRGWSTPAEMRGSWAGAMGHTQWMPEVWLDLGIDYDGDGRISPFGKPDDALATTARFFVTRGNYRRGEHWGYEVTLPSGLRRRERPRTYAAWRAAGVTRADGQAFPQPDVTARLWVPVDGGPAFLLGRNFFAVRSYNPSMHYTLSIVYLGDRIAGRGPFVKAFPGSERPLTLAEIREVQQRLTAIGFDTKGTDGRVGTATMLAVQAFQKKTGITPADGYAGLEVLARLRKGL